MTRLFRTARVRNAKKSRSLVAAVSQHGRAWRRYSVLYRREHPLCVDCKAAGIIKQSAVVDHIKNAKRYPELFWDPENHQALCAECHGRKTAQETRRTEI